MFALCLLRALAVAGKRTVTFASFPSRVTVNGTDDAFDIYKDASAGLSAPLLHTLSVRDASVMKAPCDETFHVFIYINKKPNSYEEIGKLSARALHRMGHEQLRAAHCAVRNATRTFLSSRKYKT